MYQLGKKFDFKLVEINIIIWIILLYLFRTTIPVLKFPFILFYSGIILSSIINPQIKIASVIKGYITRFYLSLILAAILVFSFFLSNKLYLVIFKDILNAVILLSLFFIVAVYIKSKKDLYYFINRLMIDIILLSVLISILLICNFLNIIPDNFNNLSNPPSWITLFRLISLDYNFALLPLLFGMISILFLLNEFQPYIKKVILNLILILYSVTILFSGSRRGMMILMGIIILLLILQLFTYFGKISTASEIAKKSRWFLMSIGLLSIIFWLFTFHTSYSFKNNTLKLLGSKDISATKISYSLAIFKYTSIFNKQSSFSDIYQSIWFDKDFNKAKDPDSGWGTENHKTVYPLLGANVEIVPSGTRGYLMDSTCNSRYYANSAYSYTLIDNNIVQTGDTVFASVYCFVSKDFNGDLVSLSSGGSTYGNIDSYYDVLNLSKNPADYRFESIRTTNLNNGTIQGLPQEQPIINQFILKDIRSNITTLVKTEFKDNSREITNLLDNGDFNSGSQFWLAEADSTIIESIDTQFGKGLRVSRTNGDGGGFSLRYTGRPIIYHSGHEYQIKLIFKVKKGRSAIPFRLGWWVNDNNQGFIAHNLPLKLRNVVNNWVEATCSYKFSDTHYDLPILLNSLEDYSIVEIASVELIDLDQDNSIPVFIDQLEEIVKNYREVWRKLTLKVYCKEGEAPVYLFFSKSGVSNFTSLKGYVIFAYPKYQIIKSVDTVSSLKVSQMTNRNEAIKIRDFIAEDCVISSDLSDGKSYLSDSLEATYIYSQEGDKYYSKISKYTYGILFSNIPVITTLISLKSEIDPIRRLAANIISEDTTYTPFHSYLFVDTINNNFFGPRLMRWQFALQIFSKEFNLKQKIFGGGFDFLNWYGYYFLSDKKFSDYPHNPFLSILLYSGLLGLIVYLVFLGKGIYYYLKYYTGFEILAFFFAITFFFSFFSGGSPFDPPIMGFLVLLPYFINYIHKREEK